MGASSPKNTLFPICLLSLTKIEDFSDSYKNKILNNNSEIAKIISELIDNYKLINKYIPKINELIKKENILDIEQFYEFILDKLDEEYNDGYISPRDNDSNKKENEKNNLIQNLFYGEIQEITKCLGCNSDKDNKKNKIILSFDLSREKTGFDISNIFNDNIIKEKAICNICQKENTIEHQIKYIRSPKIIIVIFNNNKNGIKIKYNYSEIINKKEYNLICYINNSDEMSYKKYNDFHIINIKKNYDIEDKNWNTKNPIIFIYQEGEINEFYKDKNYTNAIIKYYNLKKQLKNTGEKSELNE